MTHWRCRIRDNDSLIVRQCDNAVLMDEEFAMHAKWPWFERHFDFDFPPEKMPDILERLRGTPDRAAALVVGLSSDVLTRQHQGTWSIQENLGHMTDLDPLWVGRFNDILEGHETMRDADLSNRPTFDANHHHQSIEEILRELRFKRQALMATVESLSIDQVSLASNHPRLKTPMRIVDLCSFVADHDDYHLARVTCLKKDFMPGSRTAG